MSFKDTVKYFMITLRGDGSEEKKEISHLEYDVLKGTIHHLVDGNSVVVGTESSIDQEYKRMVTERMNMAKEKANEFSIIYHEMKEKINFDTENYEYQIRIHSKNVITGEWNDQISTFYSQKSLGDLINEKERLIQEFDKEQSKHDDYVIKTIKLHDKQGNSATLKFDRFIAETDMETARFETKKIFGNPQMDKEMQFEKIKVKMLDIVIVECDDLNNPYYNIRYITQDGKVHLGFGSHNINEVLSYRDNNFELIEGEKLEYSALDVIFGNFCGYLNNPLFKICVEKILIVVEGDAKNRIYRLKIKSPSNDKWYKGFDFNKISDVAECLKNFQIVNKVY